MSCRSFAVCLLACFLCFLLTSCAGAGGKTGSSGSSNGSPIGSGGLKATTTLQAETANNTSAAGSFTTQTNGNPAPANVSKLDAHTLLYPGTTTKIYAHMVGWFGESKHMNVGYKSDDPAQVQRQVEDMISRGINGTILDWYGPDEAVVNGTAQALRAQAEAHPGFEFGIMEDVGSLFPAAGSNGCDVTDQLIGDLNYIMTQYGSSPAFIRLNNQPALMMFGVTAFYVDWNRVRASIPANALLLFRGTDPSFTQPFANGGFQWVDINTNDPFDQELAAQANLYQTALQNPARVAVGSAYKAFNDTLAMWGTNRFIFPDCGNTWLATFAEIGKFYSSNHQLAAMQLVTWNDYEEGTAMEPGISNCVVVTPATSGNNLNWTVSGGPESTIDHYTVLASVDGQNLASVGDVPAGTHTLNLSSLNLGQGTFIFYVKAVGKPCFQNQMSPAIAWHQGDQPPVAVLALTQPGPLTINASTAGSTAADGSIASSSIDFGDGTVVSETTASHTYAVVGRYNITAAVTDNAGASAVVIKTISVKPTTPGVTLFAPPSGVVQWPTSVIASAALPNPITSMTVSIDGQQSPAYITNQDTLDTALKVFSGTHRIVVQASDNAGASSTTTSTVNAEPNDAPPQAVLTFKPLPSVSPNTVLFCSVNSIDADGFILTWLTKFSDGTTAFTPGVAHTFSAPGTYSATTTVMDQFGLLSTTSQSFNVGGTASVLVPAPPPAPSLQEMQRHALHIRR